MFYDKRGLIEKLWSSTTFFVWSSVEEHPGGAGALANRARRLEKITRSTGDFEKKLAKIHAEIITSLINQIRTFRTSHATAWRQIVQDKRVERNISLLSYHLGEIDNYFGSIGLNSKNLSSSKSVLGA